MKAGRDRPRKKWQLPKYTLVGHSEPPRPQGSQVNWRDHGERVLQRRPPCLLRAECQQEQQESLDLPVEPAVLEVAGALLLVEALAVEVPEVAGALLLVEALAAEVLVVPVGGSQVALAAALLEAAGRPEEATAVSIRLAAAVALEA